MIKQGSFERSSNKYIQIAKDFIAVCPNCKSVTITIRKRKMPKYRCKKCGNEFDNPKAAFPCVTRKQKYDFGRQYFDSNE